MRNLCVPNTFSPRLSMRRPATHRGPGRACHGATGEDHGRWRGGRSDDDQGQSRRGRRREARSHADRPARTHGDSQGRRTGEEPRAGQGGRRARVEVCRGVDARCAQGRRSGARKDVDDDTDGDAQARQVTITANVERVDATRQVVLLQGPGGRYVEAKIKDPAVFKTIKPGDKIDATYTEAVLIEVVAPGK